MEMGKGDNIRMSHEGYFLFILVHSCSYLLDEIKLLNLIHAIKYCFLGYAGYAGSGSGQTQNIESQI